MGAMMVAQHRSAAALHAYVLAVAAAGLGALALVASGGGLTLAPHRPVVFWVLVAGVLVTESIPILMHGGSWLSTTAEAFAFAILLGWGTAPAALALVAALVIADLLRRAAPEKLVFNAGQYGLCMVAAGGAYALLGGERPFTVQELPAFAAAALLFFLANTVVVAVVRVLAYGRNLPADLKELLRVTAFPYLMVFGMGPILLLVAERNVGLLPLLMLPQLAVVRALRSSIEAEQRRADAERAANAARALAAEKHQLAEAERALLERLRASDRLKDELLASLSGQLRTPLADVLGALSALRGRGEALSASQRAELVVMAEQQGERLKELVEQLLLAAWFDHAAGERAEQPTLDAAVLAGQAAAAAKVAHPERTIVLEAAPTLAVRADPEALLQVLVNLLENAARCAPDQAPIRLQAGRAGAVAVLAVEDAGPAVLPAEREGIFGRFTPEPGAGRRLGGVGLYVARQLARAQGGELLVAEPQAPGYGARFELRLPLAEQAGPVSVAADGTIVERRA